jgi:hypothetical protein
MPRNALPSLLEGYREITPLPPEYEREIRLSSLLIGIRALARSLQRGPSEYSLHLLRSIRGSVRALAAMS